MEGDHIAPSSPPLNEVSAETSLTSSPPPPSQVEVKTLVSLPHTSLLTILTLTNSLPTLVAVSSSCRTLRTLLWPPPPPTLSLLLLPNYAQDASLALLALLKSPHPKNHPRHAADVIRALTRTHGADVRFFGDACLRHAVRVGLDADVVKALMEAGAGVEVDTVVEIVERKGWDLLRLVLEKDWKGRVKVWEREWEVMKVVMGLQGNLQSEEALLIILEKCGDEFLENGWLNAEAALLVIEEVARRGWVKSSQELIGITSKAVANDESGVKAVLERMLVACCDAAVNIVEKVEEHRLSGPSSNALTSPTCSPNATSPSNSKLTTPDLSEIQSHLLTILNSLLNLPTVSLNSDINDHAPLRAASALGSLPLVQRFTSTIPIVNPLFATLPASPSITTSPLDPTDPTYTLQPGPHRVRDDEPLRLAASMTHTSIITHLLSLGSDPESLDGDPIIRACSAASFETLTLLLLPYTTSTHVATETLADVIAAQDYASLRVAASSPSATPILTFLLALGADVHADDDDALARATLANAVENVRVLVDAGADVGAHGGRCLRDAKRLGFMGVVEILEGKKAKKGRRKVGRDGFRMSGMWGSAKVVAVDGVVKEKE